jgi:seryl-tRNA synthetase
VPIGNESANKVIKKVGGPLEFDFQVKDHLEIGESLDLIDVPRAAKVSGSRFGYLKNEAALLEFALVQFTFKTLVKEGFTPVIPPALIKKEITDGLGYWQGGGNENYYLVSDFDIGGEEEGKALPLYR